MDEKTRCQSCGMPLAAGFYGAWQDGKENLDYCKFCFQEGGFTEPTLSLDDMLARSIAHMQRELKFSAEEAEALARRVIPQLRRWQPR